MAKKVNIDLDLRKSTRFEVHPDVKSSSDIIIFNQNQNQLFANCFDFSTTGMRVIIKTDNRDLFKVDEKIQLSFIMPVSRELFDVEVKVIWVQESNFEKSNALILGVDFLDLSEKAKSVLNNYIEISKMSNQLGAFVTSTPRLVDRLKDGSTWFAILAVCIVAVFAFFLGQSLQDFQSVEKRLPASSSSSK